MMKGITYIAKLLKEGWSAESQTHTPTTTPRRLHEFYQGGINSHE